MNPAARIFGEVRKTEATEVEDIEVFSPEELASLLAVTAEGWPQWHTFLLCLARTGIRLGEAMALEWRDIDFDRRVVIVRRARRKGRVSPPKNGKGRRVDMSHQLTQALQSLQSLQEAEAALGGRDDL